MVVGWLGRGTTTLHCTHLVLAHRLKVLSLFLLRPRGRNCRDSALRVVSGHPDNLLLKLMGSTCPDDGAFLLVLSHVPRRLFLTQWPRQYFRTTCVKFGRSLATPQCRWGMDARAIRSETLCVFRGRFHPYRWKGQLAVSAEAGAPDCR